MLSLKGILGLDASGFELGLKRAGSAADKFQSSIKNSISNKLAGFLSAAAIAAGAKKIADYAGEVNDLSQRLGISTDAVQQWEHAAVQAGGTADHVAKFFEALAVARGKALGGDQGALNSFAKLGVQSKDLSSKRLEEIGFQIGNAVKAGDAQKLIAALKDVGGKGAMQLVAAFKSGLAEAFQDAPLIKTEDIIRLDALGDQFNTFGKQLMAAFAPVISFIGQAILGVWDDIRSIPAFLGEFMGTLRMGGTFKDALKYAQDAIGDIEKESNARDKAMDDAVKNSKNRTGQDSPSVTYQNPSVSHNQEDSKTITRASSSLNINSLQQAGALVRFNPLQNEVTKNTEALRELTRKLVVGLGHDRRFIPEGFTGNSHEY